jgi:hypothetical protein
MVVGRRVRRLMDRAKRGMVRYQGVREVLWRVWRRVVEAWMADSRRGTMEKARRLGGWNWVRWLGVGRFVVGIDNDGILELLL